MNTRLFLILITGALFFGSGVYLFWNDITSGIPLLVTKLSRDKAPDSVPATEVITGDKDESREKVVEQGALQLKTFTVKASDYTYAPKAIAVQKGDAVKIVFVNTIGLHDFVIDELNIKTNVIKQGETEVVEFVADTVGEFTFYCSVGNHRQMGMEGVLTVSDK